MLPKLNSLMPPPDMALTCRSADGRERPFIGALARHERVMLTASVPRTVGACGVVIRIFSDDGSDEHTDIPFEYSGGSVITDIYTLSFSPDDFMDSGTGDGICWYEFLLPRGLDTLFSDTENNVDITLTAQSCGRFRLLVYRDDFTTPEWLGGGIMYHIFVDRFRRGTGRAAYRDDSVVNGDWKNGVPQYGECPGAPVKNNVFFGGNLWGVREELPYLSSLGVTVIYLSPVFTAASNHKYDTADYLHVDPGFGGDEAFLALLEAAHAAGIRIILDGVFNHTGDDSIYFDRYSRYGGGAWDENGSPYRKWFFFRDEPEGAERGDDSFASWWGIPILPKLDLSEPSCRDFFIGEGGVCEKYIRMGADGWRLDVADELPDEFLTGLRQRVKAVSPEAAIIGEVWETAADKISYGKRRSYFRGRQLDSVMNYPLRSALLGYAGSGDASFLADELLDVYSSYPRPAADVLMNIIGTHDTERILTLLGAPDKARDADGLTNAERAAVRLTPEERRAGIARLRVVSAVQYAVYGFPCVYYGDERGMEGLGDPFCRYPMVWDERTDEELVAHYRRLAAVRKYPAFDRGDFALTRVSGGYIEFTREKYVGGRLCRVRFAANLGAAADVMHVSGGWRELYSDKSGTGEVSVPPCGFVFICEDAEKGTKNDR